MMDKKKISFYYGFLLIAVGFAVFYRIPQVAEQMADIEYFSKKMGVLKFCFYMLGVFLVAAGGIRIYKNY
jgi:hypothetical protein